MRAALALAAATCGFAAAKPPVPAGTPVSAESVLSALDAANVPARSAQVEFLTPITLNQPLPVLKIRRLNKWRGDAALATVSCAREAECIPFLVVLRWSDPRERQLAVGALHRDPIPPSPIRPADLPAPLLVRAGQEATLLLQNEKMRIATPIICLQSGRQGQRIRVASLDHKRVVEAEVMERGLLRGSLWFDEKTWSADEVHR